MTGSAKWPATAWRALLEHALGALDEADPDAVWALGGGTALALRLAHRVGYDIDIFLNDAEVLRALSPNRNRAARAIADRWQEPGHALKLECAEGAIDFLLASRVTESEPWTYRFKGRAIRVEMPAEILAKQLKYHGSQWPPRDVFDALALIRTDIEAAVEAVRATPEGTRRAINRTRRTAARYRATIAEEVNPTSSGAELLEHDPEEVARTLEQILEDLPPR